MTKRRYFVSFENDDSIVVNVNEDVNRPNNPSCDEVLESWVTDNYGTVRYEYSEIETCEIVEL